MSDDSKGLINPNIIAAFVKSTQNVLSTMVQVESQIGKPQLKNEQKPTHDVSGIVGFSGDVIGSVVISFCQETAVSMVEAFCGEKLEIDDEDFADAVGELSNMIAGNAKKSFRLNANISIPSVIIGPGHSIAQLRNVPCVVIPCSSDVGDFAVEVNIKEIGSKKQEVNSNEVSACR